MFDYERAAGKAFMKDRDHRLKSFKWTNTGIKLTIPKMNKEMDLGKYDGDVDTGSEYKEKVIEVNKIYGELLFCLQKKMQNCKNILPLF